MMDNSNDAAHCDCLLICALEILLLTYLLMTWSWPCGPRKERVEHP